MSLIHLTFDGVYVHLLGSKNANLPVPYRVVAPATSSVVSHDGVQLGRLFPFVVINGTSYTGPLAISVTGHLADGTVSGAPRLPPPVSVPSLHDLAAGSELDPAIAFALFPANDSMLLDLESTGSWNVANTLLSFDSSSNVEKVTITLQQSPNGPVTTVPPAPHYSIAFTNTPANSTAPVNNPLTLLGFFGVSTAIPCDASAPTVSEDGWIDPSQPGCSNSQWP